MNKFLFWAAIFFNAAFLCAQAYAQDTQEPFCEWSILWNGSWEKTSSILLNRTFHNNGEIKLNILPMGLLFRAQVLDRRTFNFDIPDPLLNPIREVTNFTGGLYHTPTGSRALFGVIYESGLPARIRNPWIRSPPYPENHRPITANLRTEASSTREDEAYLYLSTPLTELFPNVNLRCFGSAQMTVNGESLPEAGIAYSGGLDFKFGKRTNLLIEVFYTEKTLPPSKINTWFAGFREQPVLPEREFRLYAAGFLFKNQLFSVSSDFAVSETFARGTDIYANLGLSLSLKPFFISFAADGAGQRFVYRDGAGNREGFRSAFQVEWRGRYSALFRIDTVLRSPGFNEDLNLNSIESFNDLFNFSDFTKGFTQSSAGIYYRAPSARSDYLFRLTGLSLYANRNASNPLKINDYFTGTIGTNVSLKQLGIDSPLRINLRGTVNFLTQSENPSPFPVPDNPWVWDSAAISCEFVWSYGIFQIRSRTGYTCFAEKDEKWDFSISTLFRFKQGRLSLKAESDNFPEKWNWSISWRIENHGKN
ncbi:MAG: hypothetical protein FWD28_07920 [Treponema sp.]|nr:hypothetical protein [Treponema sp.]